MRYKPAEANDFCVLQIDQMGAYAHLTSCSLRMGLPSRAYSGWGVMLTTRQHVARRLQISRTIPPIPSMPVRRGRWRLYRPFVPATLLRYNTARSESRCALRLRYGTVRYVDLVANIEVAVEVFSC
jgi:hypothetical protein